MVLISFSDGEDPFGWHKTHQGQNGSLFELPIQMAAFMVPGSWCVPFKGTCLLACSLSCSHCEILLKPQVNEEGIHNPFFTLGFRRGCGVRIM